jgi:hypothetical protein
MPNNQTTIPAAMAGGSRLISRDASASQVATPATPNPQKWTTLS